MAAFCTAPAQSLGMVRNLLASVDCNVQSVTQSGYQAVTAPDSQLALALTALMTIYVAVFGLRLLLGVAPLRIGDLTMTAIKLGVVLVLATSWPTYQQLVFDTLFHGPEQVASAMMSGVQSPDLGWRGNVFDALQSAYDQMQAAAAFFTRIATPTASPLTGGPAFAALALNLSSFLTLFISLGLILTAKIVLGLMLALGPVFVACLLFDGTRGVFEGWLRAVLAFAFLPMFATLALVIQLTLLAPHLQALAKMPLTGQPNLPAATAVLVLTLVAAMVSLAGVIGLFIVAIGFKLPAAARLVTQAAPAANVSPAVGAPATAPLFQPRIVSVSAAAAAMDRRDLRIEQEDSPRRFTMGPGAEPFSRAEAQQYYRRSRQPRRSAGSARRDK